MGTSKLMINAVMNTICFEVVIQVFPTTVCPDGLDYFVELSFDAFMKVYECTGYFKFLT